MKKTVTKITAVLCVVLLLAACGSPTADHTEAEPEPDPIASVDIQEVPPPEEPPQTISWQVAYADFLRNLTADEYHEEARMLFGLRDLDGNSIPELILLELMPASIDTFNKCDIYLCKR